MRSHLPVLTLLALLGLTAPLGADTYTVTLDAAAAEAPMSGRVVLYFVTETGRRWDGRRPLDGPFFGHPQPIASMAVEGLEPGGSVTFDRTAVSFPLDLDTIDARARIQAILDADQTERSLLDGPGNVFSTVVTASLRSDRQDQVNLVLDQRVSPPTARAETPNLRWVEVRSPLLSRHYGRDVYHRAGVALPQGYIDPESTRKQWPTIYVIPGYGGRHEGATTYGRLHALRGSQDLAPQAVFVVLDPESPLGHHGFMDSPNHGPRGSALVLELIPYLESMFRLGPVPEARLVTGHSSGGWSALWLQLQWPDVFGGCWASAPDPIDFSAFQAINLYEQRNVYTDPDGEPVPSYRLQVGPGRERVMMTVRQEALMELAIDPAGGSGQQWDAWEAMFSPRDPATGLPRPMFDPRTGEISPTVLMNWSQFDICRLVEHDWDRLGPIVTGRVRLACGTLDSYYLNGAVERFKAMVDRMPGGDAGPGYIQMVDGATHGNLQQGIFQRWNKEMREHLRTHGWHE